MDLVLDILDPLILDSVYEVATEYAPLIIPYSALSKGLFISTVNSNSDDTGSSNLFYSILSNITSVSSSANDSKEFLPLLSLPLTDREAPLRQIISLYFILLFGGGLLYLIGAGLSYILLYDKASKQNPKYLKNQIQREIALSLNSLPWTAIVTVPWFYFELRGYSKLYDTVSHWSEIPLSIVWFLAFTDCFVYWIHRGKSHFRFLFYRTIFLTLLQMMTWHVCRFSSSVIIWMAP
jgi:hypothetical protein